MFHVLNRGVGRMRLFAKDADFEAFERIVEKTLETRPMRILAYCLMPNHWHLLLWPERTGDLAAFMQGKQTGQVQYCSAQDLHPGLNRLRICRFGTQKTGRVQIWTGRRG